MIVPCGKQWPPLASCGQTAGMGYVTILLLLCRATACSFKTRKQHWTWIKVIFLLHTVCIWSDFKTSHSSNSSSFITAVCSGVRKRSKVKDARPTSSHRTETPRVTAAAVVVVVRVVRDDLRLSVLGEFETKLSDACEDFYFLSTFSCSRWRLQRTAVIHCLFIVVLPSAARVLFSVFG